MEFSSIIWLLLAGAALYFMHGRGGGCCGGSHGSHTYHGEHGGCHGSTNTKAERSVETVQDPICGMWINKVGPDTISRTGKDGELVYFCSEACAEKFEAA